MSGTNPTLAEERWKRAERLRALLKEWLAVPFFETRREWSLWVAEFRLRVEAALADYEACAERTEVRE
jgi:hypothetical protein